MTRSLHETKREKFGSKRPPLQNVKNLCSNLCSFDKESGDRTIYGYFSFLAKSGVACLQHFNRSLAVKKAWSTRRNFHSEGCFIQTWRIKLSWFDTQNETRSGRLAFRRYIFDQRCLSFARFLLAYAMVNPCDPRICVFTMRDRTIWKIFPSIATYFFLFFFLLKNSAIS